MKKFIFATLILPFAAAHAGKLDREYAKTEMNPAIGAAEAAYKTSCGCAFKINVDAKTITVQDQMSQARHIANSIKDGVAGYCTDKESKDAVCKMTSLKISLAKETKFSLKGSEGHAETDGQSYVSFDMMTAELDK